jgi:hypothetical protein
MQLDDLPWGEGFSKPGEEAALADCAAIEWIKTIDR